MSKSPTAPRTRRPIPQNTRFARSAGRLGALPAAIPSALSTAIAAAGRNCNPTAISRHHCRRGGLPANFQAAQDFRNSKGRRNRRGHNADQGDDPRRPGSKPAHRQREHHGVDADEQLSQDRQTPYEQQRNPGPLPQARVRRRPCVGQLGDRRGGDLRRIADGKPVHRVFRPDPSRRRKLPGSHQVAQLVEQHRAVLLVFTGVVPHGGASSVARVDPSSPCLPRFALLPPPPPA